MDEMSQADLQAPNSEGFTYSNLLKRDRRRWTYAGELTFEKSNRQKAIFFKPMSNKTRALTLSPCRIDFHDYFYLEVVVTNGIVSSISTILYCIKIVVRPEKYSVRIDLSSKGCLPVKLNRRGSKVIILVYWYVPLQVMSQ